MTAFICHGCGTQYADSERAPVDCRVCIDERQYVEWAGQSWTTLDELRHDHRVRVEHDADLVGVGVTPGFAIPQRALYIDTDAGHILWDCITLITDDAVAELRRLGGVDLIAISHPHFYSSMVEWSDAFGGVPILVHADDQRWISRPSPNIKPWNGDQLRLSDSVTLHHCPGHFDGSALLHWTGAPRGRSVILAGDTLHVTQDRRHVTFMYSVPNYVPIRPSYVAQTRDRLAAVPYDDLYGFTWGLNIIGNAKEAAEASFDRYFLATDHPELTGAGRL